MKRTALVAVVVVALVALSAGIALASGKGDDSAAPITGKALARASTTALASTGSGKVTETEVNDEDGYYEVEVTLDGGKQVDVHLDRGFRLLSTKADTQEAGDRGDASDG
jgi:uncharacterized membrane protein YkoI